MCACLLLVTGSPCLTVHLETVEITTALSIGRFMTHASSHGYCSVPAIVWLWSEHLATPSHLQGEFAPPLCTEGNSSARMKKKALVLHDLSFFFSVLCWTLQSTKAVVVGVNELCNWTGGKKLGSQKSGLSFFLQCWSLKITWKKFWCWAGRKKSSFHKGVKCLPFISLLSLPSAAYLSHYIKRIFPNFLKCLVIAC